MPVRHLDLISHWRLSAPAEQVWAALTDPEVWPQWWPNVRSVRTLRCAGADGLGSVRRVEWATGLFGVVVIDVEAIESQRLERLRGRWTGALRGDGIWLLRAEAGFTDVTAVWRIELVKRWMRWLAPVLTPLFRRSHSGVMRAGCAGLVRHLATGSALSKG